MSSQKKSSLICRGWESLSGWAGGWAAFTEYLQRGRQLSEPQQGIMWEQGTLIKIREMEQKRTENTEKASLLSETGNPGCRYLSAKNVAAVTEATRARRKLDGEASRGWGTDGL